MSNELGQAFTNVMNSLSEVSFKKDAFNGGKKNSYITLDSINIQLLPKLRENNLSFIVHRDCEQNFWGTLTHMPTLQEYSKCFGRIELSSKAKKSDGSEYEIMNTAQAQGATLTYARRYVTSCFFNLVIDADSDAEVLSPSYNSYTSPSYRNATPREQAKRTPELQKIKNSNIEIEEMRVTKRDYKTSQGVLKTVVNVKTKEGESENIWLNSLDSHGVKRMDIQFFGSALSYLLQTKDNSHIRVPLEVTQKIGLSSEAIQHLEERKRTNTLEVESLQQILSSQEYADIPF